MGSSILPAHSHQTDFVFAVLYLQPPFLLKKFPHLVDIGKLRMGAPIPPIGQLCNQFGRGGHQEDTCSLCFLEYCCQMCWMAVVLERIHFEILRRRIRWSLATTISGVLHICCAAWRLFAVAARTFLALSAAALRRASTNALMGISSVALIP